MAERRNMMPLNVNTVSTAGSSEPVKTPRNTSGASYASETELSFVRPDSGGNTTLSPLPGPSTSSSSYHDLTGVGAYHPQQQTQQPPIFYRHPSDCHHSGEELHCAAEAVDQLLDPGASSAPVHHELLRGSSEFKHFSSMAAVFQVRDRCVIGVVV